MNPIEKIGQNTASSLSPEEATKLTEENYRLSQVIAREEFEKIGVTKEEAVAWFDEKYKDYGVTPVRLRDRDGNLLEEKHLEEISSDEKLSYSLGTLKLISDNYNVNFIKHFFNEPELLDLAEKQGINLKRTVEVYRENLKKLGQI